MEKASERLAELVRAMAQSPIPGFADFNFSTSTAVMQIAALAAAADEQTAKILNDPAVPKEGRAEVALVARRAKAVEVRKVLDAAVLRLQKEIATAIPAPTRPDVHALVASEILKSLDGVDGPSVAAFYMNPRTPPDVLAALEGGASRIRITASGMPTAGPLISAEQKAERAYLDATQEQRDRHAGLTEIRGGLVRIVGLVVSVLEKE